MAIRCGHCGREYDVTLFEFGRTIVCECGSEVDALEPHRERSDAEEEPGDGEQGPQGGG